MSRLFQGFVDATKVNDFCPNLMTARLTDHRKELLGDAYQHLTLRYGMRKLNLNVACAGINGAQSVIQKLLNAARGVYDPRGSKPTSDLHCHQAWACEIKPSAQKFILANYTCAVHPNLLHLLGETLDLRDDAVVTPERSDWFIVSPMCKDESGLNANRKKFRGAIAKEMKKLRRGKIYLKTKEKCSSSTAATVGAACKYMYDSDTQMMIMEEIVAVLECHATLSAIKEYFQGKPFLVIRLFGDAADFLLPQRRRRGFLVVFRLRANLDPKFVSELETRTQREMTLTLQTIELGHLHAPTFFLQVDEAYGSVERPPRKFRKTTCKTKTGTPAVWMKKHAKECARIGIPFVFPSDAYDGIDTTVDADYYSLGAQQRSMVDIVTARQPPVDEDQEVYVVLSQTLKYATTSEEILPTQTSNNIIFALKERHVLTPTELMASQGWMQGDFRTKFSGMTATDLIAMSGDAFPSTLIQAVTLTALVHYPWRHMGRDDR